MARKVYYSKPLKYFWQYLYGTQKKLTPEFTNDQIFSILRRNILAPPLAIDETQESRGLIVSGLELWREDSIGNLLHIFFLDKHLRDFLETTPLSDLEGIKKFMHENGKNNEIIHLYSDKRSDHVVYKFALHLPYESNGYAFSLSIEEDGAVELYFSHGENGGRMSDKFYADLIKKSDEFSQTISKMFRLAINTIAYMNCFPDCVTDGVPNNLFERGEDKSVKNFTLQLSEKVKEVNISSLSKIPHFRKGYFKLLQSDYFVNKKGQIIYIAETMVKGKAKTVSTSSKLDEFSSNISKS